MLWVETKKVPAPSGKGLLTDVRDTSIIKRKFKRRELFKNCDSRLNNKVHITEIGKNSCSPKSITKLQKIQLKSQF